MSMYAVRIQYATLFNKKCIQITYRLLSTVFTHSVLFVKSVGVKMSLF